MDVPEGYWPLKHVEYAVDQDVLNSYDDGCYRPKTPSRAIRWPSTSLAPSNSPIEREIGP
jgi:hypothetical protein